MPTIFSDYYRPNDPVLPPDVQPCEECCPPPDAVGPGGSTPGGPSGGCGPGGCGQSPSGPQPLAGGRESSRNPVRFATGTLELTETDLLATGFGEAWGHTRTYGHRIANAAGLGSYDGVNGRDWFVATLPHLVETTNDAGGETIVVLGNINAALWFDRPAGSGPTAAYVGRFAVRDTLDHDDAAEVFRLRNPDGSVTEFHDFDQIAFPQGLFKRRVSPGGQTTEVIAYDGGEVGEVQRSAVIDGSTITESLIYTHRWFGRLSELVLRRRTGTGPWRNLQRVVYTYWSTYSNYWDEPDRGTGGALRTAETFELNDTDWTPTGTTFYAYYTDAENDLPSTSIGSGGSGGFLNGLKFVLRPAAVARLVEDGHADFGSFQSNYIADDHSRAYAVTTLRVHADADLAAYADYHFEYDEERRVVREDVQGGTLTHWYAYEASGFPAAPNNWTTRTTETLLDGTRNIVYCNRAGMVLLRVFQADRPGSGVQPTVDEWLTVKQYDADGRKTLEALPSAVAGYDDAFPDLAIALRPDSGTIRVTGRYAAGEESIAGRVQSEAVKVGEFGPPVLLRSVEYVSHTAGGSSIALVSKQTTYPDDDGTAPIETSTVYQFHPGTTRVLERSTLLPAVAAAHNGSGQADGVTELFDLLGQLVWRRDERGVLTHWEYDSFTGAVTRRIDDADPAQVSDAPAGWAAAAGFGAHLVTDFTVDDFGRTVRTLGPVHGAVIDGVAASVRTAAWALHLADISSRETRTATGYQTVADGAFTLVNPVTISRSDLAGRPQETIRAVRRQTDPNAPPVPPEQAALLSPGEPTAADAFTRADSVAWTTRLYTGCCRLSEVRVYHDIPQVANGLPGHNYVRTYYGYDAAKRQNLVVTPGGTATRTVFDHAGRPVESWVGTNDSGAYATPGDPTGGGAAGNNMVRVAQTQYDLGGIGDGHVTRETRFVSDTEPRVTTFGYDGRGRLIDTAGEENLFERRTLDNLGRVTRTERFDGSAAGRRLARGETLYDERGRVYATKRYSVNVNTGAVGPALTDQTWYDAAGHAVKSLPAGAKLFTKTVFDGLGRPTRSHLGYDPAETAYADALSVANDTILEQTESTYDAAGNLIAGTARQRYHNATGVGPLGTPTSSGPQARVVYAASWFDPIGRQIATADFGTNGGAALLRPADVPARSDTCLVSETLYDAAGMAAGQVDAAGRIDRTFYDAADRRIVLIENFIDGLVDAAASDEDRTTRWSYTADGQVASLTAVNPATGDQTTTYLYGSTLAESGVARADLKTAEVYPDSAGPADRITFAYDRQGRVTRIADQAGTVRTLSYDRQGRLLHDAATTLGPGVDAAVVRQSTFYDARGLPYRQLCVDAAGAVVNEVRRLYDAFGNPLTDYQSHSGVVDIATCPAVRYTHSGGADNTARPLTLVYPSGRTLAYDYGLSGSRTDASSQPLSLRDASGTLVSYTRLGVSTPVIVTHPQPGHRLLLAGAADPDTGDIYRGLDRFGRVQDVSWWNPDTASLSARIRHGSDRSGNRTGRQDVAAANAGGEFDELYAHDGLSRLTDSRRGRLNPTRDGLTTVRRRQDWALDATGNWNGFREDADGDGTWELDQSRTANAANELTGISQTAGPQWATPAYDAAGNMTTVPQPLAPMQSFTATYDAWNRLVRLSDAGGTVQENAYDARGFRTVRKLYNADVLTQTRHFYYDADWRCLEERVDGATTADRQYVWGPAVHR